MVDPQPRAPDRSLREAGAGSSEEAFHHAPRRPADNPTFSAAGEAAFQRILRDDVTAEWLPWLSAHATELPFLLRTDPLLRDRLCAVLEVLKRTDDWSPERTHALSVLFLAIPESDTVMLARCFEARFPSVHVQDGRRSSLPGAGTPPGSPTKAADKLYNAQALRRIWVVFERLPREAVDAKQVGTLRTESDPTGSLGGSYDPRQRSVRVKYAEDLDRLTQGEIGNADEADPTADNLRFDSVVRHEIGHAVDEQIHASSTYGATRQGGGWREHGTDCRSAATELLEATGLQRLDGWRDQMLPLVAEAMQTGDLDNLVPRLRSTHAFKDEPWCAAAVTQTFAVIAAALSDRQAWAREDGGPAKIGRRVLQVDGDGWWTSYDLEGRGRKVSLYQFRAPAEWFAEAYSAYYAPHSSGVLGAQLAERDPVTKAWFDAHVHHAGRPARRR